MSDACVQIDPRVVGVGMTVDVSSGRMTRIDRIDETAWIFNGARGRHGRNADQLFELSGASVNALPDQKYVNALSTLRAETTGSLGCAPWPWFMEKRDFKSYVKRLARDVCAAWNRSNKEYFVRTFLPTQGFLSSLSKARIDAVKLDKLVMLTQSGLRNASIIRSFLPEQDGFCRTIEYDRFSTRTGRVTVAMGPQVLLLPKSDRNIVVSRYPGGSVWIVDYVSFEAQVALVTSGQCPIDDVYTKIATDVFSGTIDRNVAKVLTLGFMYGMGFASLAALAKLDRFEITRFLDRIREFFGFGTLIEHLVRCARDDGRVDSFYGRSIAIPDGDEHLVLNSYVQSTAVDAALLGFARASVSVSRALPLFFIHDAVIIDAPDESVVGEFARAAGSIDGLGDGFPVHLEKIS